MEISPSLKEFKRLSQNNNLIVFSHRVGLSDKFFSGQVTPLAAYHSLSKIIEGESFLLESIEGQEKICRFSFLGFKPLCTFKSKGKKVYIQQKKSQVFKTEKGPLYELKKLMAQYKAAPKKNLRFFGGFVGYLGYDIVKFYEPVGKLPKDSIGTYDSYLILPKFLIIFDHLKNQIEILSFAALEGKTGLDGLFLKEKKAIEKIYKNVITPHKLPKLSSTPLPLEVKSNFKKKDFITAVQKAKKYIKEGEVIQVVISQRFSANFKKNPFKVYRHLRGLNPSPYMFYLDFTGIKLAGASPEMLVRCEKDELVTRPIAGTRKRSKDEIEDLELEKSLLADPKEKAEHIMLVDLARNDLGRIAERTSVKIPEFMKVEKFSHVMHIVSEVRARLNKGEDIFSSLVSCFPAGTVSGAPKVRAMQIINELEPNARGAYAGAVGYFSFTKGLDTCIIIRTIIFKGGKAYVQAGAGIVNDSKPEDEYTETINKAKAQILALKMV
ncbi:MAG: anthranilate synthase component I [Candidatus Omnitrophota bacterium]